MGPDQTSVSSTMSAVLTYLREDLQPVVSELQVLAEKTAAFQVGFSESFNRTMLRNLENEYAKSMSRFMSAYKKWYAPDEMFKGSQSYNVEAAAEYLRLKPALAEHIQEGFRVMGFIDRLLGGARSVADNRVAVVLSVSAITISIVAVVLQVFLT